MLTGILPIDNVSLSSAYLKLTREGESVQSAKDKAESIALNPEVNDIEEVKSQASIDFYA